MPMTIDYPYKVYVPASTGVTDPRRKRFEWCEDHFGNSWSSVDGNERWNHSGYADDHPGMVSYAFVNEADATMFALRWAGI